MRDRNDRLPEAPSCEDDENIGMPENGRPPPRFENCDRQCSAYGQTVDEV
jgi:hypothetical protein